MVACLITAPSTDPVTLEEVKALIRVTDSEENGVVQGLIDGAVALLDGRSGLLGRAIMPQVWAQDLTLPGPWVLELPDIDPESLTLTVDGNVVDGGAIATKLEAGGVVLSLSGVTGTDGVVEYACALPEARLKTAKTLIGLIVDAWYYQRSAASDVDGLPPSCLALITHLRWHGV